MIICLLDDKLCISRLYYCSVTETVVTNLTVNDTFFGVSMTRSISYCVLSIVLYVDCLQDTTSVINNLLSESNRNSWEQLERVIFAVYSLYSL